MFSSLSTCVLPRCDKRSHLSPEVGPRALTRPCVLKAGHLKPTVLIFFLITTVQQAGSVLVTCPVAVTKYTAEATRRRKGFLLHGLRAQAIMARKHGGRSQTATTWHPRSESKKMDGEHIMLSDSSRLWFSLSPEPVFRVRASLLWNTSRIVFLGDPKTQTSWQWRFSLTTVAWKCYNFSIHLTLARAELRNWDSRCIGQQHGVRNYSFLLWQHESSYRL